MIHEFYQNGYWVRYSEDAIGGNWTTWDRFEVIAPNQVETAGLMPDLHSRWVFRDIVTVLWRNSDSVVLDPRGFEGFGTGGNTLTLNRRIANEPNPVSVSESIIGKWQSKRIFDEFAFRANLDRDFGSFMYGEWVFGDDGSLVLSSFDDTLSASYTMLDPNTLTITYDGTSSEKLVFMTWSDALILIEPNGGRLPGVIFTRVNDSVEQIE
jgi:hypothetical protein